MGWMSFRAAGGGRVVGAFARRGAFAVSLGGSLCVVAPAHAATVECDSMLGVCTLTNEGVDQANCECTMAIDGGIAGGNAWAGLTDAELMLECEGFLASWCDPEPPPTTCSDQTGSCSVETGPDSFVCDCADGSSPGGEGGNAWAGLDDWQLADVCYQQLEACPPVAPEGGVLCQEAEGWCTVQNAPHDSFSCVCADGSGLGYVGFDDWAGYSEEQLTQICEQELSNACLGGGGTDSGTSDGGSTSDGSTTMDRSEGSTDGGGSGDTGGSESGTTGDGGEASDGWRPTPTSSTGVDGESEGGDGGGGVTTGDVGGDGTDGTPGATPGPTSSGGCTVGGAPPRWSVALLVLLGVAGRRRRR